MAVAEQTTQVTEEPKDLKTTIREAATLEIPKEDKEEKQVEDKKEEPKKEKAATSSEETDAVETEQARQLYAALKDPSRRDGIIKYIAEQGGYVPKESLTPKEQKEEVKESKDEILDALKESLGSEFSFLAEKLGPAIGKILTRELAKSQADIRASIQEAESEKLEGQSNRALGKLTNDFFGEGADLPDNVTKGMSSFMEKFPPTPDLSISEYLDHAFYTTIGRLGLTKSGKSGSVKDKEAAADKIKRNGADASSRLASERSTSNTGRVVEDTSKIMTRKQAIEAAMEAVSKGEITN